MKILDRVEAFLEGLFEGAWLRPRAVLARLDRRVIRAVNRSRIRVGEVTYVGHAITVRLSAAEAGRLRGVLRAAAAEIAEAVRAHLAERDYRSAAAPKVVVEFSDDLKPGTATVEIGYGGEEVEWAAVKGPAADAAGLKHAGEEDPTKRVDGVPATIVATVVASAAAGAPPIVAEIETLQGLLAIAEGERLRVGRSADCEVVLASPRASHAHAELFAEGGRVRMRDLGSTNGTLVNGSRVDDAELDDACTLRLGGDELRVHYCLPSAGDSIH